MTTLPRRKKEKGLFLFATIKKRVRIVQMNNFSFFILASIIKNSTCFLIILGLQQPQLVVVEVRVAAAARARKERVRKDRAAPVERVRVVMVTPEKE